MAAFISSAYFEVSKNKWQNVNGRPNHEHIFMKQNFSDNCSSAPLKIFSRESMPAYDTK